MVGKEKLPGKRTGRDLKRQVLEYLGSEDMEAALETLRQFPPRKVINPLFSLLLHTDPKIKWAAVTAFGAVVSTLADQNMESARVIMRRLMWQLNDESGGIGWGCPEAMGEIMACHEKLAQEYAAVLISYIRQDGNFLEYELLQPGALWGIGRLAQVSPGLARDAGPHLLPFLKSPNAALRGLAAWVLGLIGAKEAVSEIEPLVDDAKALEIYLQRQLRVCRVKDLAEAALARIRGVSMKG